MVDGVVSTRQLSFAGFGEIQICGEVKTPSIIVAEIHLNIFSHKMTTNDERRNGIKKVFRLIFLSTSSIGG